MPCVTAPTVAKGDADRFTLGQFVLYLALGTLFGLTLVKSEAVSWFRMQEMFRFQSFHMYGIIGSAVVVAALSLWLIRRFDVRTVDGHAIQIPDKAWGTNYGVRYWLGGTLFGLGWALLGACPGPLFALLGAQVWIILVPIAAALLGTWAYAYLQPRIPH